MANELKLKLTVDGAKLAISDVEGVSGAFDAVGNAAQSAVSKVDTVSKVITDGSTTAKTAVDAVTESLEGVGKASQAAAGKAEAVGKAVTDGSAIAKSSVDAVSASFGAVGEAAQIAARKSAATGQAVTISAAQMNAALRGVPAQFTDIVVSLSSGQAPLTVLLQQGGQLKDMFGGVGNAAKALGGYVLGLINPLTIIAATGAAVALAYHDGSVEAENLSKSIIQSGNAANTSVNQLKVISASVAEAVGTTKGSVTDALQQIVGSGKVSSEMMGVVADSAIRMERAAGKAISSTVAEFTELGKEPVKASLKLNEQYNYLTADVYKQIKAFEDQGKASEAAALAQNAYADAMNLRSAAMSQNLGTLETAWKGLGDVAKSAWDKMLNLGREGSLEERIASAKAALKNGGFTFGGETEARAQLAVAEAQLDAQTKKTESEAKSSDLERAKITWMREGEKYLTKAQQMEMEIVKARAAGAAAGKTDLEINQRIAAVREKFTEKKEGKAPGYQSLIKSIQEKTAVEQLDLATTEKLTDGQRFAAKVRSDLEGVYKKLTPAQKASVEAALQEFLALEKANDAQHQAIKAAAERTLALNKAVGDEQKHVDTLVAGNAKLRDEISTLGLSTEQQALYQAEKIRTSAATESLTAAQLDEAAALLEEQNVLPEVAAGYRELAAAKRAAASEMITQADLTTQRAAKEVAVKAAADSTKAWEKFADDIERSLTDSLYRSFEAGKGFGETFIDSLKATLKAAALKMVIQYAVTGAGNLVGTVGNAAINAVLGTSSANNGSGYNILGLANNASSLYGVASGTYLGYYQAASAGYGMTATEASAAANAYYQAGYYGTGASIQAGNMVGGSAAGTSGAAGAGAESGAGSGASSSAASTSSIAWVAAIVMGMYMSSEAWKNGIRWDNTYGSSNLEQSGVHGLHHENQYNVASAIFGESFAKSQFWQTITFSALSQQLSNWIFGSTRVTGRSIEGTFSDASGFNGQANTSMHKSGGWFKGGKDWTESSPLSSDIDAIFESLYREIKTGLISVGAAFDDSTLASKLVGFTQHFSASGDASISQLVTDWGDALTESMGNAMLPSINATRAAGEKWSAALQRVLQESDSVNNMLGVVGKTLLGVFGKDHADAILAASDNLVKLFGTVDQMNSQFGTYYSTFYSTSRQLSTGWRDMAWQFAIMGRQVPTTIAGFRDMVDSIDLTTAAGQSAYVAMIKLAPAFSQLIDGTQAIAKETASALIDAFTAKGTLAPTLVHVTGDTAALAASLSATQIQALSLATGFTVAQIKSGSLNAAIGTLGNSAGSISSIFLDASSPALAFGDQVGAMPQVFSAAQLAGLVLNNEIDTLRQNSAAAKIDIAGLGVALNSLNTDTFVATINLVFQQLATRIQSVIGNISTERIAVRDAALSIVNPTVMTKEGIQRGIAAINTNMPSNAAAIAANTALTASDTVLNNATKAYESAAAAATNAPIYYQGVANQFHNLAASFGLTANATGLNNDAYNYNASTNKLNPWNNIGYTVTETSSGGVFDRTTSTSSTLQNKPAFLAAADGLIKILTGGNAVLAQYAAKATAAASAMMAAQATNATAVAAAKKAALDYSTALQDFALDASKSVSKLTRLREETVKYYEAQKALADLMANSATGLRSAVADYRYSQMNDAQQLATLQKDYATAYSMGLSTSGDTLAGYADRMNSLLAPMLEKASQSLSTTAYQSFAATALARAEAIASRLDTQAPSNYAADSLNMLGSIDATLAALDASSRSAELIIADAVKAGSDRTADGLRAVIAALTGKPVPAFAAGGDHAGGLRLVGENGPELEVTGPSRIFNASQTRSILAGNGGSNADLVAEIRALRADNENMRAELRAIASHTSKLRRLAERSDQDGVLVRTDADTPLKVATV